MKYFDKTLPGFFDRWDRSYFAFLIKPVRNPSSSEAVCQKIPSCVFLHVCVCVSSICCQSDRKKRSALRGRRINSLGGTKACLNFH